MGWGEQVLRQLDGKPFYERARRRDPVLDAAIRDAVSACTGQATGNKYHAVQTEVDGIRFDSKAEAARWSELRLAERAGAITQLERQVKLLLPTGITWRIDFTYVEDGMQVYEDVKGKITSDYRIKRDMLTWQIRMGDRPGIYREVKRSGAQGMENQRIPGGRLMEYTGICIECGGRKGAEVAQAADAAECNLLATDKCRHRRPGIFVERYGVCTYCGQVNVVQWYEDAPAEECNERATEMCTCPEAARAADIRQQVERGRDMVIQLFGEVAEERDLRPAKYKAFAHLMDVVEVVAAGEIAEATVRLSPRTTAKIKMTANRQIKVERTDTTKYSLED